MASNPFFNLQTLFQNIPPGVDLLLRPEIVAELIGVDKKWLASAREGRKKIQGPPFIKLGEGRTAPIRYRLGAVMDWIAALEEKVSGMHRIAVPHFTYSDFLASGDSKGRWLYLVSRGGEAATEFFEALRGDEGLLKTGRPVWLTREEYERKRFVRAETRLDRNTINRLLEVGRGDLAEAIALLLSESKMYSID